MTAEIQRTFSTATFVVFDEVEALYPAAIQVESPKLPDVVPTLIVDCDSPLPHNDPPREREPMLSVRYCCPECDTEWLEAWTSACDSTCPCCGTTDIMATSWKEIS